MPRVCCARNLRLTRSRDAHDVTRIETPCARSPRIRLSSSHLFTSLHRISLHRIILASHLFTSYHHCITSLRVIASLHIIASSKWKWCCGGDGALAYISYSHLFASIPPAFASSFFTFRCSSRHSSTSISFLQPFFTSISFVFFISISLLFLHPLISLAFLRNPSPCFSSHIHLLAFLRAIASFPRVSLAVANIACLLFISRVNLQIFPCRSPPASWRSTAAYSPYSKPLSS